MYVHGNHGINVLSQEVNIAQFWLKDFWILSFVLALPHADDDDQNHDDGNYVVMTIM